MAVVDVSQAQLFSAVEGFLLNFSTPPITNDGNHIIPGFTNDQSLPNDGGDFCIYTPISMVRRGTDVEEWFKDTTDAINYNEYVESIWQIDCYSKSPAYAQQRVQTYETIMRSPAGVAYFSPLYVDCLFADSPRNLSMILDSKKYRSRWSIELHLGFWKQVQIQFDYFTSITPELIDVDAKFKP